MIWLDQEMLGKILYSFLPITDLRLREIIKLLQRKSKNKVIHLYMMLKQRVKYVVEVGFEVFYIQRR